MGRSSDKSADDALVSKWSAVANYSYPRKGSCSVVAPAPSSTNESRCSSNASSRGRESVDSEGSAPGLVDDRTDSELSGDDDYQYHAHVAELWDSFWSHRADEVKLPKRQESLVVPSKQYPALIPSPRKRKQQQHQSQQLAVESKPRDVPAWPLPNSASPQSSSSQIRESYRKSGATYSAFPRLTAPPPTRSLPPIPVRVDKMPARHVSLKPRRPARPAEKLLTPCIQQSAFVPVTYTTSSPTDHATSQHHDISPAVSPTNTTSSNHSRPSVSFDSRHIRGRDSPFPTSHPSRCTIYSVVSHSATHLPAPEIRPSSATARAPRHHRSIAALSPCQVEQQQQQQQQFHSVFEEDSEDEYDHSRKLFSFHRRSESESHRRRRNRSNTTPSPSTEGNSALQPAQHKRHGHDVFGRILGRRSR